MGLTPSPRQPMNTRRWPRFQVHLPVLIAAETADSQIAIPGMVSALSRAGMEVYGGVPLRPGDRMEVEFKTSGGVRITGIVRNRSGYCFGIEFLRAMVSEIDPDERALDGRESGMGRLQHCRTGQRAVRSRAGGSRIRRRDAGRTLHRAASVLPASEAKRNRPPAPKRAADPPHAPGHGAVAGKTRL